MDHASVFWLLKKHSEELRRLGTIEFAIPQSGSGCSEARAILTEPQALLLLTFMKNTPLVKAFKERLVFEFYRKRDQHQNQTKAPAQSTQKENIMHATTSPTSPKNTGLVLRKEDGELCTTSRVIAEKFKKQHKNVIQKIEGLPKDDFYRLNFQPTSYFDSQNRVMPEYLITRDGFSYIAMSFTGPHAHKWKVQFINAFNTMEKELQSQTKAPAQLTRMEILKMAVEAEERAEREEFGTLRFDIQKSGDLSQILAC